MGSQHLNPDAWPTEPKRSTSKGLKVDVKAKEQNQDCGIRQVRIRTEDTAQLMALSPYWSMLY